MKQIRVSIEELCRMANLPLSVKATTWPVKDKQIAGPAAAILVDSSYDEFEFV